MARHPWQMGLSVLGVALGVAVVVSIDLANQSAKRAFALSTEVVAGKATHQIIGGPGGIPEDVYRQLRVDLGVRDIAPIVSGFGSIKDSGSALRVLGIDPFAEAPFRSYLTGDATADVIAFLSEPGAMIMSEGTARKASLNVGDGFDLNVGGITHRLRLIGVVSPEDAVSRQALSDLLVTDISSAQEMFGLNGRLSRIDLIAPDSDSGAITLEAVKKSLPDGVIVERTAARSNAVDQMTRAFDLNLTALSLLALVVGTFLIYNTMTFSVVRRRMYIGTLRAIGVTRGEVFALVLGEALLIGVVSSGIGLVIGILLGQGLVQIVTRTINDIFFVVSVSGLNIEPLVLVKGAVLGIVATLVAATVPAFEATTVSSRTAMSRASLESGLRRLIPRATTLGLIVLSVSGGLLFYPSNNLFLGFGGLFGIVFGSALLIPVAVVLAMALLNRLIGRRFGIAGTMATRGVVASLSRTAVAISALSIAVSITIGIGVMVGSFRGTVEQWLDTSLRADVYVSAPNFVSSRVDSTLSPEVITAISHLEGVEHVGTYRRAEVRSQSGTTQLSVLDTQQEIFEEFDFKEGSPKSAWDGFQSDNLVLVSEPYAYHHDLGVGSTLRLATDSGEQEFLVGGVFYDYSSSRGLVTVSRTTYQRLWNDSGTSSLAVYARSDIDIEAMVDSIRSLPGIEQELNVRSNRTLREASLEVFDRTFAITSVMRVLALIVAFIGVLSALMALQMERSQEIGVLRAIGFTPGQVWALVTSQTGLMGLLAGLLAIPTGLAQAAGLIYVVNRRSFGWSMDMQIQGDVLIEAVVLALVAALLAGLYPAFRMALVSPANALREE